jgi:putative membrane protein (TIGR04086 family)
MKIRWGLALLGGFLAEAGIFAVMPIALQFGDQAPLYVIPPTCLVMTFVFGFWVSRRAGSRFVLHGALVGVVAALIYIGLTLGQTVPLAYVVSHFLKVLGGMAGGFVARRQFKQSASSDIDRAAVV